MEIVGSALKPDGRQSETASLIQRGVGRLLRAHDFAMLTEFTLNSGRRADVIALSPKGLLWIIEIKSSPEDFKADNKWPEYRDYCDQFSFAIPQSMDAGLIPQEAGLIIADHWGAEIIRPASEHPLHASRRRAVHMSFARIAAQRLHGLWDP
ncbi:MAG: MmcB family DNA repair protein [Alphaproteobacteria bacterium]|nr:MmcB family DNA repair protein [Alphaproteobacteria bacterium]